MNRRDFFRRAATLIGVAVASRLPMPEPTPVPLKPVGGTWHRIGADPADITYYWHDSGLSIADYGDGVVRNVGRGAP